MKKLTLLLLFLFPVLGLAQTNQQRIAVALQNNSGYAKIIPFAQITVCIYNEQNQCNTPVTIYYDSALSLPIDYPYYADANGNYSYYTHMGTYVEKVCAPLNQCYNQVITLLAGGGGSSGCTPISSGGNCVTDNPTVMQSIAQPNATNFDISTVTGNIGLASGGETTVASSGETTVASSGGITIANTDNSVGIQIANSGTQPIEVTSQNDLDAYISGNVNMDAASIVSTVNKNFLTNILNGSYYAAQFGTGSNGIETVYNNSSNCIPQGYGISFGCTINVQPIYTNADAPQGWNNGGANYGGMISGFQMPGGTQAIDYRNGTFDLFSHNSINPVTGQATGFFNVNDYDLNWLQRTMYNENGAAAPVGVLTTLNNYAGGFDFQFYPSGMPQYVNQAYSYGINDILDNWTSGIDFGNLEIMNHHGKGDALLHWESLLCDGGILAGNSEGCEAGDVKYGEDNVVFTGYMNATVVGGTVLSTRCSIGCGTQGQGRLLLDVQNTSYSGTFFSSEVGPQTTGPASNSAVIAPQVTDSTANFPVSTLVQLCYPGSDNGASGATGCTSGSQPVGYVPAQPVSITITAWSISGNIATFTTNTQNLQAGMNITLFGFPTSTFFNNISASISATGLTSTQFEIPFTHANGSGSDHGEVSDSITGFSPISPITLDVVAPYTTGSGTNGLPSGFCSSSNLQSSNSGGACYMPASGVGCLTDGIEYETDNYTYNSGSQTITITGMRFPHMNGVMFATGGLCGYAVEDEANKVPTGFGTTGVIAPTYAIAGSLSSTTFFYIPQRVNEQYGSPLLGISNPSNGNFGYGRQLYFSAAMSSMSVSGGVVTFSLASPPQVIGNLSPYNGLTVSITTNGDVSYNGSYPVTWVSGNTFTYTPTSPTGTVPTSGTATYSNAAYKIYPAARVLSVYNPATNKVGGYIQLMPNTVTYSNNDQVLEPHYQQMMVTGMHYFNDQYSPEQYLGSHGFSLSYGPIYSNSSDGLLLVNTTPTTLYQSHGGTLAPPGGAYELGGIWRFAFNIFNIPENDLFVFTGCKADIGCSSANSSFNLFAMPTLPNSAAGINGTDVLNYDPNYMSSTRSQGLYSGRYYFSDNSVPSTIETSQQSYATVQAGYLTADQNISAPAVQTSNINITNLPAVQFGITVVGTVGSTSYNYWVVGHGLNGGTTVPREISITNGNATLSGTNYNQICVFHAAGYASYDILRTSTTTSVITNLSATSPNGGTIVPSTVANYSCFNDVGGATSVYVPPSINTIGGINASGPVVANSLQLTGQSTVGVALFDVSGSLTSGTALPNGTTATTQATSDNSTKVATTAYVQSVLPAANVANITISIPSFAIPANTCYGSSGSTTPATATMTGVTTSMAILPGFTGNASAITGWGSTGGLNLEAWSSAANTVSYLICNPTAASITGGAITLILAAK